MSKMQTKVLVALVAAVLVAGLPEPDPNTDVDVVVDSADSKVDSYFQVVKTAGQTTYKLVSKLLGQAMGYKGCKVKVAFSYDPVKYNEYDHGAKDVPCGGRLAGVNGECVDGNVVCEIDNMGNATNEIIYNVDNWKTGENKTITLDLVPGSSLFDAMLIANQTNDAFRFTYTLFQGGVMIQCIDEICSKYGATSGWGWNIFYCGKVWTPTECTASWTGVSEIYPKNGDIWTWRYDFVTW